MCCVRPDKEDGKLNAEPMQLDTSWNSALLQGGLDPQRERMGVAIGSITIGLIISWAAWACRSGKIDDCEMGHRDR